MPHNQNLTELTDEELIKKFQETNELEAYEILVRRYKDPLMNFVYRFVGDRDVSSDIVQDTMIKFYLNKDSYREFAKFSTWIYTIAGNL
ncbi:MAG: sigma factor, partial [Melioribacter sp.]|nr:sigma factor [Melioribacter sp.]